MSTTSENNLPPPPQAAPEHSIALENPAAEDKLPVAAASKIPRSPNSSLGRRNSSSVARDVVSPPSIAEVIAIPDTDSHPVISRDGHDDESDSDGTVSDNPLRLNTDEFPTVKEASEKIRAQTQEAATEKTSASHPFTGIVSRVAAIPTVSETVSFMNETVTSVARKHRIARLALSTTMKTVSLGASFAEKIAAPVKPVLDEVDHQAVRVLDRVEKQFPIINRPPRDIVTTVSDMVTVTSDTAAHKVLEIRPIRSCVQLSATTLRSLNDNVDKVLHKAHLEGPNQHSTIYTTVESLTRHVLGFVDETRNGDWRSKVEARRQSRCDIKANTTQNGSSNLIASYHGAEIISA